MRYGGKDSAYGFSFPPVLPLLTVPQQYIYETKLVRLSLSVFAQK